MALDDFSGAAAGSEQYWFDRDAAAVLVTTSLIVGNERAIKAAVEALGKERAAEIIPGHPAGGAASGHRRRVASTSPKDTQDAS